QVVANISYQVLLHFEVVMTVAPGAPEQPAPAADSFAQGTLIVEMTGEYRRLGLRLAFSAHSAVAHATTIIEYCESGIKCVKRLVSGLQCVALSWIQTEAHAQVIPHQAGTGNHQSRPELPINTLDKADHGPVFINAAHPHGIARLCDVWPG